MSRPLRYERDGAFYHVVNRGNRHGRVFVSHRDYELFIEKLEDSVEIFDVRVLAYCLMPNHFHLYLSTRQANLSRFMQRLLTSFCVAYNKSHRSSGHVFQGRFKSHIVEDRRYGTELSRYIHLNPVRTKQLEKASFAEKLAVLQDFRWSSYACHIGGCRRSLMARSRQCACPVGRRESQRNASMQGLCHGRLARRRRQSI